MHLPGAAPAETYLRAEALIDAARRTGADAVHPGYGFLSENAGFARACAAAGLVFVGPSPEAIEAMGSKTAAKDLMRAAGVPVLPGAVFDERAAPDEDQLRAAAAEVGLPVLVKAAFGGGGRGMRIVRELGDVADAVASARREAASAFGNGTVFLERYVDSPRHIEVQIVGDHGGTVTHLFERECSIQRRYQKIIEEAPSPAVDDALRTELCQAAVAAGKAIGYTGAGTVEFVLDSAGRFYFLEVNTRLQVEHPVTELVTGINLVKLQLEVAAGKPVGDQVLRAELNGHAIEARLYAEDVPAGYLPTSGDLHTFEIPADGIAGDGISRHGGVRVDAGVACGTRVSTFYDSMLAKVIGYGATRDDARRLLASSLSRARLHGVTTNRDLLVGILREEEFTAGAIDTGYLDRHPYDDLVPGPSAAARTVHPLAAALAGAAARRAAAPVLASLPSGFRNNPSAPQSVTYGGVEPAGRAGRGDLSHRPGPHGRDRGHRHRRGRARAGGHRAVRGARRRRPDGRRGAPGRRGDPGRPGVRRGAPGRRRDQDRLGQLRGQRARARRAHRGRAVPRSRSRGARGLAACPDARHRGAGRRGRRGHGRGGRRDRHHRGDEDGARRARPRARHRHRGLRRGRRASRQRHRARCRGGGNHR